MKSITLDAMVDEQGNLKLILPDDFPYGKVKVKVLLEQPEDQINDDDDNDEDLQELLEFRRKHHLDEATIMELVNEGRR